MMLPHDDIGSGEPTLTFVHGFTQTRASWRPVVSRLSVHHRCIVLDAPHHGEAKTIDTDFVSSARHIAESAIDSVLVGYSMGGRLSLAAALDSSAKLTALVVVSGTAGISDGDELAARRHSDDALADHIEDVGTSVFLDEWLAQPMFASTTVEADDLRSRLTNDPQSLARSLRRCGVARQPSLWDRLSQIAIPTLIMAGERDGKFRAIGERLHESVPESEFVTIPNAGHAAHLEAPDQFVEHVDDFVVRRVTP